MRRLIATAALTLACGACGATNDHWEDDFEQSCGGVVEPPPTKRVARAEVDAATCMAASVTIGQPNLDHDAATLDRARRHMTNAIAFVLDPDGARWEEALPEVEQAYLLSGSRNALALLAQTSFEMERYAITLDALRKLREGGPIEELPQDRRPTAELLGVARETAWLSVRANVKGYRISHRRIPERGHEVVNEYEVADCGLRLAMKAGEHRFTFTSPPSEPIEWEAKFRPGDDVTRDLVFMNVVPADAP